MRKESPRPIRQGNRTTSIASFSYPEAGESALVEGQCRFENGWQQASREADGFLHPLTYTVPAAVDSPCISGICFDICHLNLDENMTTERHVRLFRNGRNQALRIPREFELEGDEAIIRREGDRLIVEPVLADGLLALLSRLQPLDEAFPDIDEGLPSLDDVEL